MKSATEILAWKKYPEPDGTLYTEEDLILEKKVQELFDGCQKQQAYITADGWEFLFDFYETSMLIELHSRSMEKLMWAALTSGYNPIQQEQGDYDEDTGYFITLDGLKYLVDWEEIKRFDVE